MNVSKRRLNQFIKAIKCFWLAFLGMWCLYGAAAHGQESSDAAEDESLFMQKAAQMAAHYHTTIQPVKSIHTTGGNFVGLVTKDKKLVYAYPFDLVYWSQDLNAYADTVVQNADQFSGVEFRITGTFSSQAESGLKAIGINALPNNS